MPGPTHPNRPIYCAGKADVGLAVLRAFRAHWALHKNASPQKIILTAQQADDLYESHVLGRVATPGVEPPKRNIYLGRPIEVSDSTLGEIVALDGKVMQLADYYSEK